MSVELIIDSTPEEVTIAILHEKHLVELHREKKDKQFSVGDIYLGKVKKVMPGLSAAFVNVGAKKDAFLHYLDLGPQFSSLQKFVKFNHSAQVPRADLSTFKREPDIDKAGKVADVLKSNQQVLVQIAKEPISTKGPRLNSELSIAGRFLVLTPFSDQVSISQKIKNIKERKRLVRLVKSIKPKGFGIIIRTVAENKKVADLHGDMSNVYKRWEEIVKNLNKAQPPKKVLGELNRTSAILRDLLSNDFNRIIVNDEEILASIKDYLGDIAPEKAQIAKLYKGKRLPLFDFYNIEKKIKELFGRNVTMSSGAYLIIDHTEAMHVVDVNSGNRRNKENSQEQNAFEVNMEAAEELARQLRLRDMGGIIVVDFIDMKESIHRKKLFNKLKDLMKDDRARHSILPPSKFGVIEITRQRVRPEMDIKTNETCPCCGGTGDTTATILLTDKIENDLKYISKELNINKVSLYTHPFVAAYLKQGILSVKRKWQKKHGCKIELNPATSYQMLEYNFFDSKKEEIKL